MFFRPSRQDSGHNGFEALLEHQLDALTRFAFSLCRNRHEAEDLLQDSVLRGLKAYGSFEAGSNFKAWIFTVMMNCFRSRYRQRLREKELPLDAIAEPAAVGEDVFARILRQELLQAVGELPEGFKAAVLLVDMEGLSYREAAEAMGCPRGTLMSRLQRGRGLLKQRFSELAQGCAPASNLKGATHELP